MTKRNPKSAHIRVRVTPTDKDLFFRAAAMARLDPSEWVRDVLRVAAVLALDEGRKKS